MARLSSADRCTQVCFRPTARRLKSTPTRPSSTPRRPSSKPNLPFVDANWAPVALNSVFDKFNCDFTYWQSAPHQRLLSTIFLQRQTRLSAHKLHDVTMTVAYPELPRRRASISADCPKSHPPTAKAFHRSAVEMESADRRLYDRPLNTSFLLHVSCMSDDGSKASEEKRSSETLCPAAGTSSTSQALPASLGQ